MSNKSDINKLKFRLKDYLIAENVSYNKSKNTWRCCNHQDNVESAVYYEKGKNSDYPVLWCPSCGFNGSVFDVAGKIHNTVDFKQMLKIVKNVLGVPDQEDAPKRPKEEIKTPIPFPTDENIKKQFNNIIINKGVEKEWGNYSAAWKYHDKDGNAIAIDVRYEREGERKVVTTWWFDEKDKKLKWYSAPAFVYNRHLCDTDKPIIIHEGAKNAEYANERMPEFLHIAYSGGSSRADKIDWSFLNKKEVYILPDDDEPGEKAAKKIKKQLPNAKIIPPIKKAREIKIKGADIVEILQVMSADEFKEYILNIDKNVDIIEPDELQISVFNMRYDNHEYKYDRVEAALNKSFDFRKNVITDKIEWCEKAKGDFRLFTDYDFNSIRTWLMKNYINHIPICDLKGILNSIFTKKYCPITEYFENLPQWDGQTDYIQQLCDLVTLKKDQFGENVDEKDVFYDYMRRWLVGNVSGMLQNYENHTCMTFFGSQGLGKSTFLRRLAIDDNLTYVGSYNPGDKDSRINLAEKTLIVLDEFESTTKYEMAQIKSALTMRHISVRRPYATNSEVLPRRASFCACANRTEILSDLTGSRRWLCVEVEKLDYQEVTYDLMKNVYAQAKSMLDDGFEYFRYNEIFDLEKNNEQFSVVHPEEEALLAMFEPANDALFDEIGISFMTNTQIMNEICEKNKQIKLNHRTLGMALKKHGFVRKKIGGLYKYKVEKKLDDS